MSPAGESGPLRLVHFLPSVESASGGPVRSTLANCRAAHAADPEIETVLISTRHGLEPAWEWKLRERLPEGMILKLFPQVGHHTTNVSPALLRWLWRHAAEFDLLVLRALMHPLTSAVGWVARRKRLPYLAVPHGTLSEWTFQHRRTLLKKFYFRLAERRTLEGAAAVRFTSESERAEAERLNFDARAVVLPHPYEPTICTVGYSQRERNLVLFLARIDPKKGIDLLLDAIVYARAQTENVRLVLAGSGSDSYERKIRAMVQDRGLREVVSLPGFVTGDEKQRLLRKASVFVLPSRQENFGISAVEALDAGLPVVISPEVDIAPHVEEYRAGYVVERTAREIARSLLNIINNPERAEDMGERGRDLVRDRFDPEVVGPKVVEIYREMSGRSCSQ